MGWCHLASSRDSRGNADMWLLVWLNIGMWLVRIQHQDCRRRRGASMLGICFWGNPNSICFDSLDLGSSIFRRGKE